VSAGPSPVAGASGTGSRSTLPMVAALCLLWAVTFIVQRHALEAAIGPAWMAAGRAGLAAVVLCPLLLRGPRLDAAGWRIATVLGLTNIAGFTGLQILGLDVVGAGPAAAILYLQPVLVTVGAWALLGESLTARRLTGVLLGLAGVAVISADELTAVPGWAIAALLVAALCWTAGTLVTRATPQQPVLAIVAAQHVVGAAVLVAAAVVTEAPPVMSGAVVWAIGFTGLGGSAAGWLLFTALLRRGEAGVVAAWLFSVPILAALLGVLLLGEPLRAALVVGLLLVATGVRLAVTPGGRRAPPERPPAEASASAGRS
jgi:drug/metabolite transporter (DMT)-like permease